jgi:ATP-dependent exoDNAse (exonuclease V) alpha subunit
MARSRLIDVDDLAAELELTYKFPNDRRVARKFGEFCDEDPDFLESYVADLLESFGRPGKTCKVSKYLEKDLKDYRLNKVSLESFRFKVLEGLSKGAVRGNNVENVWRNFNYAP